MPAVNPFSVFSQVEIADAINIIPNSYGRIGQANLFPVKGVPSSTITIEEVAPADAGMNRPSCTRPVGCVLRTIVIDRSGIVTAGAERG